MAPQVERGWSQVHGRPPRIPLALRGIDRRVTGSGGVRDGTELDAELGRLGLRVKLPLPDSCIVDARPARLCVLLGTVAGEPFLTIASSSSAQEPESPRTSKDQQCPRPWTTLGRESHREPSMQNSPSNARGQAFESEVHRLFSRIQGSLPGRVSLVVHPRINVHDAAQQEEVLVADFDLGIDLPHVFQHYLIECQDRCSVVSGR
jgi:hypothetical protein